MVRRRRGLLEDVSPDFLHRAARRRAVTAGARVCTARALDAARAVSKELVIFHDKGGLRIEHVHAAAAVNACRPRQRRAEAGREGAGAASERRQPKRAA